MSDSIRIWSVQGERLTEIRRGRLDLEARLETWMLSDVSVLSDDLLVIGSQIDTRGHGILDLLCLDRRGDLVVVELKREKTPREVTAQALDYGAWVADLSAEDVQAFGDGYHEDAGGLAEAFRERFGDDLPEVLNNEHHLLVVGSAIDDRTERIIRYLSESHGVSINALTFNYFTTSDGRELLARTHLIEPETVEVRSVRRVGSKRRRSATMDDHREEAERQNVGDLYDRLLGGLGEWLIAYANISMVTFESREERKACFNVIPSESEEAEGLRFNAYSHRLGRLFGVSAEHIRHLLPAHAEDWQYGASAADAHDDWRGVTGTFRQPAEIDRLLSGLAEAPRHPEG